jgi:hypothetical protein
MKPSAFQEMVAQLSHFGWAALIVTWLALLAPHQFWWLLAIGEFLAAVKEFVYDLGPILGLPFGEPVENSGGVSGSILDFSMYSIGALVGVIAVYLKGLI